MPPRMRTNLLTMATGPCPLLWPQHVPHFSAHSAQTQPPGWDVFSLSTAPCLGCRLLLIAATYGTLKGFLGSTSSKVPSWKCKRHRFNHWIREIPWRRHGNPIHYSCLENFRERGAWQITVHGVMKSQTQLKRLSTYTCTVRLSFWSQLQPPFLGEVLNSYSLMCSYSLMYVCVCTVCCQSPLFMEFSRQEYWSRLPFPPPGDLPHLRTEPVSPALSGGFFTTAEKPLGSLTFTKVLMNK